MPAKLLPPASRVGRGFHSHGRFLSRLIAVAVVEPEILGNWREMIP